MHKDQEVAFRRLGVPGWRECLDLLVKMQRGWGESEKGRAHPGLLQGRRLCLIFSPEHRAWCSSSGSVCQIGLIRNAE